MVKQYTDAADGDRYGELQDSWPERPSRKRERRAYRRRQERHVVVEAKPREQTSTSRMSRALLAAQRELAQAQTEKEARADPPQGDA